MLRACTYSRATLSASRHSFVTRRPTANRDIALILVLLDTGMRASELCALKGEDVDLREGKVEIKHGVEGRAKGSKGYLEYFNHAQPHQGIGQRIPEGIVPPRLPRTGKAHHGSSHQWIAPRLEAQCDRPKPPDNLGRGFRPTQNCGRSSLPPVWICWSHSGERKMTVFVKATVFLLQ
jgi:integrase